MGKNKPTYNPAVDAGDYVTVTNAAQVHLSGKKGTDKVYRRYSGFMGGLKEVPITRLRERKGEDVSHPC
jgi:large subunit ribosomal protein L13